MSRKFAIAAGAALIATAMPAIAVAQESREVRYSHLDLGSEAGRENLQQQIETAVRRVCGSPRAPGYAAWAEVKACRSQTLAEATEARDAVLARFDRRGATLVARAER